MYSQLHKQHQSHGHEFYLKVDDIISYEGQQWKLVELIGQPNMPISYRSCECSHELPAVRVRVGRCLWNRGR